MAVTGACGKGDRSPKPEKHRTARQRLLEIRALIDGEQWERANAAIAATATESKGLDASELALCRGIVQKARGRDAESKKSFEGALVSARGGPKERVRAHLIKAEAAQRLGRTDEALVEYHNVLREKPGQPRALKALEEMFLQVAPARIHLREIGRPYQFGSWFGWHVTAIELAVGSAGMLTVELVDRGKRLEGFSRAVSAEAPIKLVFGYRERTGQNLFEALKDWIGSSADVAPLKAILPAERRVMEYGIGLRWLVRRGSVRWESFGGQSGAFKHPTGGVQTSVLPRSHFSRHPTGGFFEVHRWTWKVRGSSFRSRTGSDGTEVRVRGPGATGWVWKPLKEYPSPVWVLRAKLVPSK